MRSAKERDETRYIAASRPLLVLPTATILPTYTATSPGMRSLPDCRLAKASPGDRIVRDIEGGDLYAGVQERPRVFAGAAADLEDRPTAGSLRDEREPPVQPGISGHRSGNNRLPRG